MNSFSPCFPSRLHVSPLLISVSNISFKPLRSSSIRTKPIRAAIPARDRIIDFGKYKGKMLGTLPSKYLKWVSKSLRARDFEEWAKLADEVLDDPVYRDRIEWEFAENVLNGNSYLKSSGRESSVSDLLEISERFNWNNDDKIGWSRVDFALLGTSKGGRIPRKGESGRENERTFRVSQIEEMGSLKELGGSRNRDLGLMGFKSNRVSKVPVARKQDFENEDELRLRRSERRKKRIVKNLSMKNGEKHGDREGAYYEEDQDQNQLAEVEFHNPFPGREALLRKVLNNRRELRSSNPRES